VSRQQPTRPCPTCGDVADYAADQLLDRERSAAPVTPERRTVSLEVLTDELRAVGSPEGVPADARIGVILRRGGKPVVVADTDTPWLAARHGDEPVWVLRGLLSEMISGAARLRGDGKDVGLLMPTPDVLAALDGRPDATYWTAPIPVMHRDMQPGWQLISYADEGDTVPAGTERQEPIEAIVDCTPEAADGVHAAVYAADCRVLTVDGTRCHFDNWLTNLVRIPAAVTR
jgi:hypothetical protein